MEEHRRTRSQGPPSLPENNEIRYWGSLPDPLQIERDHAEAFRLARQATTGSNMSKNTVESSEISQVMSQQTQPIQNMPLSGEISPKQHEKEGHTQNATEMGKILPNQPHERGDLEAMEEGVAGNTPTRSVRDEQG